MATRILAPFSKSRQNLEYFVESDPGMQRRLLKLLDKWISMSDREIAQDCRKIAVDLDYVKQSEKNFGKVKQKMIRKLASRLAAEDRFDLDGDMDVCINLYHEKFQNYLVFTALELRAKVVLVILRFAMMMMSTTANQNNSNHDNQSN